FHMAQQVVPADQLVPRYHTIRRCNNFDMLQSIPFSKVPDTEDMIKFMLDTEEFTYTVDMFRVTLHFPVETPKNSFVTHVNIQTIKAFMNRVSYQCVVNKVRTFYMKNLAQPWQTMFKVFNRYLTTRTSGHDQTQINILQLFHAVINQTNVDYAALLWWDFINNVFQKKEAIQYPRFIKLIIADLMKKFPNIPQRIDEDYHSIKDDILLVSVYTTGNVLVRGMLILDEFLTEEIRATDDFKEYEMVFVGVEIPMNQSQLVVSTQGTHSTTLIPSPGDDRERDEVAEATILSLILHKTALAAEGQENIAKVQKKLDEEEIEKIVEGDEDEESYAKPESHKEHPEIVNDDDDQIEKEKKDEEIEKEKKDKEIGKEKNIDDVEKTYEVVKKKILMLQRVVHDFKECKQDGCKVNDLVWRLQWYCQALKQHVSTTKEEAQQTLYKTAGVDMFDGTKHSELIKVAVYAAKVNVKLNAAV
ncbi:hypothetical protein Tco_0987755, partial [Tanacetum coccineum]